MLCLLWNQKIYYIVHNGLPMAPILIQINSTEAHEKLVDYRTHSCRKITLFLILLACSLGGNCEGNEFKSQHLAKLCIHDRNLNSVLLMGKQLWVL